jgi:SAM-dependent methyltransferase
MPTMPPRSPAGQPAGPLDRRSAWFESAAGQALLASESGSIRAALAERAGPSWLWLAPTSQAIDSMGRGLQLQVTGDGWNGPLRCALPLPLATESVATVVVQHSAAVGRQGGALIEECARVLVPGGRLWLYVLNPLSPYRWRWRGVGLRAAEPMRWRRRLREAGLQPEGISLGLGPRWRIEVSPELQQGPGVRAAYLLRAEKRSIPLTPVRQRAPLRIGEGVPAA